MSEDDEVTEVLCDDCNCLVDPDDSIGTNDGNTLCTNCGVTCDNCNWIGSRNNDNWFDIDGNNEIWCDTCTENHAS